MNSHGLQLGHHKTEAIMLTKKRAFRTPELVVDGSPIEIKRRIKYLGVTLDSHLTFTQHLKTASLKATKTALALGRLMPNKGGPFQCKRSLLMNVVNSKLFYTSPVWNNKGTKYQIKGRLSIARREIRRCVLSELTARSQPKLHCYWQNALQAIFSLWKRKESVKDYLTLPTAICSSLKGKSL